MGFALAMIMLFAFYGNGLRFAGNPNDPFILHSAVTNAVNAMAMFVSLIGVLLITHEYRYNTIMYTLSISNSRSKTLLAKLIAISCYSVVLILAIGALSPLMTTLGLHLKGVTIAHQTIFYRALLLRVAFYGWGFAMIGAILAFLIRNQIGVIATLFLIPAMVEPLSGILLKANQVYLPFSALNVMTDVYGHSNHISYARAAVVVVIYVLVGWAIAWLSFLRRDAA
jgi:ABC-type transport system involved in multi-copper enzyme maturation permease subunit